MFFGRKKKHNSAHIGQDGHTDQLGERCRSATTTNTTSELDHFLYGQKLYHAGSVQLALVAVLEKSSCLRGK